MSQKYQTNQQGQEKEKTTDPIMYPILSKMCATNIIISVAMFVCFIIIFFFTYVSKVEKNIINEQISLTLHEMFDQFISVGVADNTIITQDLKYDDASARSYDKKVEKRNNHIVRNTVIILVILNIVVVMVIIYLGQISVDNWHVILMRQLVGLIVIVFTEIFFIQMIVKNYMMISPNVMNAIIIQNMLELK